MSDETVEVYTHIESIGARLKSAREERNIEISDIARWLKLDAKTISAIEQDDGKSLPQPVYTVGYIRSYAKLVQLSPDQIAADYLKIHEPKVVSLPKSKTESIPSRIHKIAESLPKRFTISTHPQMAAIKRYGALSGAFVILVVMSWFSLYYGSDENSVNGIKVNQRTDTQKSLQSTKLEVISPNEVAAINKDTLSRFNAAPNAVKRVTKPLALHKKERSDSQFVAPLETAAGLKSNQITANLSLSFRADSWVDIKDATGKELMRSLGSAGVVKEIRGVAPFEVILGNGPGVEIKYNGKVFDFSQFQGKQQVARFTLSPPH